jgi:hypothetical protein
MEIQKDISKSEVQKTKIQNKMQKDKNKTKCKKQNIKKSIDHNAPIPQKLQLLPIKLKPIHILIHNIHPIS